MANSTENNRPAPVGARDRLESFDALKAALTLLVIFHHTAITYGATGGWFYRELQPDASFRSSLLTFFCAVNQAYFMGFFFLLSGYFTPAAFERKGAVKFLQERLIRLGIPLVFFGFVLGPLTAAIAGTVRGKGIGAALLSLWSRGTFILGPLWFAEALLLFSIAFVLGHSVRGERTDAKGKGTPEGAEASYPSTGAILAAAVVTGLIAFVVRLYIPVGREIWGLQLGYFPSYILLFAVGCLASKGHRLENFPQERARHLKTLAWFTLPALYPLISLSRRFPILEGSAAGGWNLPSFLYAMWEPLVATGIILALLQYSLKRFRTMPPALRPLSRGAFCIYIIHPVVLVSIAIAVRDLALPPLIKFFLVGSLACLACYFLAGWILRAPLVRQIV